jgi:integrase
VAKRRRRGRSEGTIGLRPDGRWEVRVDLGRGLKGQRQRKSVYAATQAEAIDELREFGGRAVDGRLVMSSTPTVAHYLEDWFTTNQDGWRASTQRGYRLAIDLHLVPAFGPMRVESLTPQRIQRWLTQHKQQHGARRRIALAHAVLRSALSEAKRLQIVAFNAAELVKVPTAATRPIVPLTIAQAAIFVKGAAAHRLGPLFTVALACGLRLGEASGLRWEDIDLESGDVQIQQQLQLVGTRLLLQPLKTEKSRRALVLPNVCLTALRVYRTRQLEERLKAGQDWIETGLVFTSYKRSNTDRKIGKPLHPRNILRTLHELLDDAQLPRCRFHDLRHSAASLLLAEGVQLAEISKLLGHAELRLTSDLYSHLQRQTASKAARVMDGLFG